MLKREMIDTLKMIKNKCCECRGSCEGCPFCESEYFCILKAERPGVWNIKDLENRLFPTITHDEYIILKNIKGKPQDYYIARDSELNSDNLTLYIVKPFKNSGYWDSVAFTEYALYMFNHMFKSIKWEDEEPRKIRDLIKEYEEVHGICS